MTLLGRRALGSAAIGLGLGSLAGCRARGKDELLHASFDATRELFGEVNTIFASRYGADRPNLAVQQSHGGSGKQARSVIEGMQADVVSLALGFDHDALVDAGFIDRAWRDRLPERSVYAWSTIVLLVRGGNPKNILGWDDLIRPDVQVVTPNPKTSGGARWNHLAAWGHAVRTLGERNAEGFIERLYKNVSVLDSGARGALTTFTKRKIGDVLIAWESEALTARKKLGDAVSVVIPDRSIRADLPVAVVDKVVDHRGSRELSTRYAELLFEGEVQGLLTKFFYRPQTTKPDPAAFPEVSLFAVEDVAEDWRDAHRRHFAEGALFDQVMDRLGG